MAARRRWSGDAVPVLSLRSDLVAAVFRHELDECVAAAPISEQYPPGKALAVWGQRYREFVETKRGLASALHSGDPAYAALPEYFHAHAVPALGALLENSERAGEIRANVTPVDMLGAISHLCVPFLGSGSDTAMRMVVLLLDGLRYRGGTHS
ncbi:hypothetical protein [Microbacterium sp. VKM Ac-2870]|uniref:SbtR family transcriptional regulator n=1 Tax=Microbacterium sp. VKM Ac-2870 TaxID=2783825 RepID=UPI002B26DE5D|nr:hypothetical protein [Microbacterium sp. VKM Ac-2870]